MPEDLEGWIERVNAMAEEVSSSTVVKAYNGNSAAQAIIEGWAVEMQAAALFLATYVEAETAATETLVDAANTIIDAVQAILLAVGIILLLKRLKKKNKGSILEITVGERKFRTDLGDKTQAIPQGWKDTDKAAEAAYLKLRIDWTTHFLLTMLQALKLQTDNKLGSGKELVWKAHLDSKTCSICKFMHNKRSIKGDFLPVILKQFPNYKAFVPWMGFPHAHPRCRCVAVMV